MITVYKTNIPGAGEAASLVACLRKAFPGSRINIDLHDCDRVLRIEGTDVGKQQVENLVSSCGFSCAELE